MMNKKTLHKIMALLAFLPALAGPVPGAAAEAGGASAAEPGSPATSNAEPLEEVVVTAIRKKSPFERAYTSIEGKRFFEGPYGENTYILAIGQELKARGEKKRVITRRIHMPHEYTGSSVVQYEYPFQDDCGINRFKFFDGGPGFMALGFVEGEREIILDVLSGGGPFSAPGLWGPYDQILGKRHRMKVVMGDGAKDGMGTLKGGYAVGMKADLSGSELRESGRVYRTAVAEVGRCLANRIDLEAVGNLLSSK